MVMYLLMFAAAIRLKLRYPDKKGSYQITRRQSWIVCLMSGVAFVTCFYFYFVRIGSSGQILSKGVWASLGYILFLIAGLVIFYLNTFVLLQSISAPAKIPLKRRQSGNTVLSNSKNYLKSHENV